MQFSTEKEFVYPIPFDVSMYDKKGVIYPAAYQKVVVHTIEKHLEAIEMDVPRLIKNYGVSWVLLSMSMELKRRIRPNEALTMRTWNTSRHIPLYRREFVLYDATDTIVAVGTTFSSVLDLKTRHICTDDKVLEHFCLPEGETMLAAQSRFSSKAQFAKEETLTVRSSWLDGLGHVNNGRYPDFVYDTLSNEERVSLSNLKRMDVWFMAELQPDTQFTMEKAHEENAVTVKGVILPDEKPSFAMKLTF